MGDLYRPATSAMVADLVPSADRTRAFGLIFWAVNLGFSVAMVLGGTLARAGFAPLFWADAATCAAFGVLVWRAIPETMPTAGGDGQVRRRLGRGLEAGASPPYSATGCSWRSCSSR